MQELGKYLLIVGILAILLGFLFYFFGNKLNWIGNLPGDIRIEKDNFRFYMPITTMILVSVVISAISWLIKKMLG